MAKLDDPAALDKHMATKSYVAGFTLSAADVELYRKIAPPPPKFANAARWYAHIASLPEWRQIELAGPAPPPAAAPPAAAAAKPAKAAKGAAAKPAAEPKAAKPAKAAASASAAAAPEADASAVEDALRAALTADGKIADTLAFAAAKGLAHEKVIGACKSLAVHGWIATKDLSRNVTKLTAEGDAIAADGSPEAAVFKCVPVDGIDQAALAEAAGPAAKVGLNKAMAAKWVKSVKGADGKARIERLVPSITDGVAITCKKVADATAAGSEPKLDAAAVADLKKRKLLTTATLKSLAVSPGEMFGTWGKKALVDLTHEMLVKGSWKDQPFKPLNLQAEGLKPDGGALHPLMKVKSMFREIFLEMGFEEMCTNKYDARAQFGAIRRNYSGNF